MEDKELEVLLALARAAVGTAKEWMLFYLDSQGEVQELYRIGSGGARIIDHVAKNWK